MLFVRSSGSGEVVDLSRRLSGVLNMLSAVVISMSVIHYPRPVQQMRLALRLASWRYLMTRRLNAECLTLDHAALAFSVVGGRMKLQLWSK